MNDDNQQKLNMKQECFEDQYCSPVSNFFKSTQNISQDIFAIERQSTEHKVQRTLTYDSTIQMQQDPSCRGSDSHNSKNMKTLMKVKKDQKSSQTKT